MNALYLRFLVLLFILFSSCSKEQILTQKEKEWLNQNPDLKVSIYGYVPPYLFNNQKGKADGVFIDYLNLIEKKIDYKFTRVHYNKWPDLYRDAFNGKIDIVLDIPKTEKREKHFDFYGDFFSSKYVIVSRDDHVITNANLRKAHVVVPEGYAVIEVLQKNLPSAKIQVLSDEKVCLKRLSQGEFDAYVGPKVVAKNFIHDLDITNLVIGDVTPFYYKPVISVTKHNKGLSKIIAKAVHSISDEEKQVILNNWLYDEVKPFYKTTPFWLGMVTLLISILIGITYFNRLLKQKIKERTTALEMTMANLEKSDAVKTRFIRSISHEIRTPMNSILGFSEILKKEGVSKVESQNYISSIIENGKHLIRLIDSILEISSFGNEGAKVNLEEISLKYVFNNVGSYFESLALRKNIDLSFTTKLQIEDVVLIDRNRIKKIIINLIDNAVKFTANGKVNVNYNITDAGNLVIKVMDTGKGIKEEDKEFIFDSFAKLDKEDKVYLDGLGLGLTIVKENVIALKGTLSFESEPGIGSVFTVSIPCKRLKHPISNGTIQKSTGHTILVVEDADINFLLVKSILRLMKTFDFTILHAENGKIGVKMCDAHPEIDLVLMDIRMPVMDGYEATRIIKEKHPDLPIIAHTAYSSDTDIQKALEAGCETVLAKPVEVNLFKTTIIKYIAKEVYG
jgi:signal transduction histidine kinase/ActR/RegA family two-component response regulator